MVPNICLYFGASKDANHTDNENHARTHTHTRTHKLTSTTQLTAAKHSSGGKGKLSAEELKLELEEFELLMNRTEKEQRERDEASVAAMQLLRKKQLLREEVDR